jgi:molybdopterin-guanine dinucleotide biosynthesis protein A
VRGVVMAGGECSRMGREKALLKYGDKSLIEYSLEALAGIEGQPLVISNNESIMDCLGDVEVIPDFFLGRGPLGGLYTALEHCRDDIVAVACDAPLLERKTVDRLVAERGAADIAVYTNEGQLYPFPGIYSIALLPDIESRLEGAGRDLSLQDLIRAHERVSYIEITEGVETLVGINTPEDYRRVTGLEI